MLLNHLQALGGAATSEEEEEEIAKFWSFNNSNRRLRKPFIEPNSVLDNRRSRSPLNSSSTLSSSLGGAGGSATSDSGTAVRPELHVGVGSHLNALESMLSDSNGQDQSFLHWITNDAIKDDESIFQMVDPCFGLEPIGAPPLLFQEPVEEKPLHFNRNLVLNPIQNPSFLHRLPQFATQLETHNPHFIGLANGAAGDNNSLFLCQNQLQNPTFSNPKAKDSEDELATQLVKAAELIEAGNSIGARGILARLNQYFPSQPVIGKPLVRSIFYFKEALVQLCNNGPLNSTLSTPLDVLIKLGTYKAFWEISPILQFTNFTSIQAILEEINGYNHIHVIDFDIGVGGHWSSFMQELAHRRGGATCSLKITTFISRSSHHPLELHLIRENLSDFATDLNIPFEFNVLSLDPIDPSALLALSSPNEAVAVNFPIGSRVKYQSIPSILRLVKQLNPKIVVSVEHGCDRSDLAFFHHFLHAFQSCTILLDSIDASGANQDVANNIERYIVQPRIENAILGRYGAFEKMVPWRSTFTSVGLVPLQFSNFSEIQAECLLKRVQVRGFQVEKRQASLFLCWKRGELVSVSAWK